MADCTVETQQHFAFDTITVPAGDSVVADQANDTLAFTSSDASVTITGTAATVNDEALAIFDGTGGLAIKAHPVITATNTPFNQMKGVSEFVAAARTIGYSQNQAFIPADDPKKIFECSGFGSLPSGTGSAYIVFNAGEDFSPSPASIHVQGVTNGDIRIRSAGTGDVNFDPPGGGDAHILNGDFIVDAGGVSLTDDIVFAERADHASTPTAGSGYLWVKNTTPSTLIFTNDAGDDVIIGPIAESQAAFFSETSATAFN
jgi:hypothetical protein